MWRSLQLIQNVAATVLTGIDKRDHTPPAGFSSLAARINKSRVVFKILLLIYMVLRGPVPSYLEELKASHQPNRLLSSAGLLVILRITTSRLWGPKLWPSGPSA